MTGSCTQSDAADTVEIIRSDAAPSFPRPDAIPTTVCTPCMQPYWLWHSLTHSLLCHPACCRALLCSMMATARRVTRQASRSHDSISHHVQTGQAITHLVACSMMTSESCLHSVACSWQFVMEESTARCRMGEHMHSDRGAYAESLQHTCQACRIQDCIRVCT